MQTPWLFLTLGVMGSLVVAPSALVAITELRRAPGARAWPERMASLLGPVLGAAALLMALWLPQYEGRCGGWLGETSPCSFDVYATETVFWAAMSNAVPGLLGIVLGAATLVILSLTRRLTR